MNKILFGISGILLILAIAFAYPVYREGKTAADNAQLVLAEFENLVLETKTTEEQTLPETTMPEMILETSAPHTTLETTEVQMTNEEVVALDLGQPQTLKPIEKPKVTFTPIAKLQIESIGLEVSVLSEWSYELLDISVNKFSGPEPNEHGNFIVIGHNYTNGAHFGSLHLLEIGDIIDFTDLSGRKVTYEVYEMLVIKPDEVEQLATFQERTLTLVTCDVNNDLRIVVKSMANYK